MESLSSHPLEGLGPERDALVVVGASLGGLSALGTLLSGLPAAFPVPVAIVQHRGADDGARLARVLQRHALLRVREPNDKEAIKPGIAYVAPAGYHLLVEPDAFGLSVDSPVCHARPSVDVLFESAADAYGERVIAVILTGAGRDGARGAARVKAQGGLLIVQDPLTAESPLMPNAALAAAPADHVLPLSQIAPLLVQLCASSEGG